MQKKGIIEKIWRASWLFFVKEIFTFALTNKCHIAELTLARTSTFSPFMKRRFFWGSEAPRLTCMHILTGGQMKPPYRYLEGLPNNLLKDVPLGASKKKGLGYSHIFKFKAIASDYRGK